MEKDLALPIQLPVWQITSEYAEIHQISDEMKIYFKYWDDYQNEVLNKRGLLHFKNVWAVRYSKYNKTRYYHPQQESDFVSEYLHIPNSSWIIELGLIREIHQKKWNDYDKREYKHYIFQNNSYYIEIIAEEVNFNIIDLGF